MDNNIRQAAIKELARRELERRGQGVQPVQAQTDVPEQNTGIGGIGRAFKAGAEGAGAGALFGFDDELTGAVLSPIEAARDWMKGDGFSIPKAYERVRSSVDARKQSRREQFPKASLAGEIAGGVAAGGGAAKAGLTTIGRTGPVAGGMIDGAGYGALYGAGEAKPGERLQGAATGGAVGAVTGGLLGGASKAITSRAASKAAGKFRSANPARSADDLASEADTLYGNLRASGAKLPAQEAARAKANIDMMLGQTDEGLAPTAFSLRKVIEKKFGSGDVDVLDWHNLSKQINLIARDKKMGNEDAAAVGMIKKHIDKLRDGPIRGPVAAMRDWKKANEITLRKVKVETIERMLDLADLDTGQYTQAELSQTIAKRFRQLYRSASIEMFSDAEKQIIRDIGQAKTQSAVMNLLKKLAPRGVVSAGLGAGVLGSMVPGGMFVVPAVGEAALRASNAAAQRAAQNFAGDVSRGAMPAAPALGVNIRPLIPGLAGTSGSLSQRPRP